MTLLEKLDKIPPHVIRLTARVGRRPMTDRDIASASGLSTNTVWRVSHSKTWGPISVGVASRFLAACGVDQRGLRRLREYIKRGKFAHLRRNPSFAERLLSQCKTKS